MSIPYKVVFGKTLCRLRQSYDLTQAELARRAGISQAAVSGLESGRKTSSLETLQGLAKSFGIAASELLAVTDQASVVKEIEEIIDRDAARVLGKTDGWMSLDEAERKLFAGEK